MPAEQSDVMAYFGLKVEVLPAAVLINMEAGMKQYRMPAPAAWKAAEFAKFEESYFSGALQPFLKSAEAVEDADDADASPPGGGPQRRGLYASIAPEVWLMLQNQPNLPPCGRKMREQPVHHARAAPLLGAHPEEHTAPRREDATE